MFGYFFIYFINPLDEKIKKKKTKN